jgi:signal transduction histidine kinase
MIIKGKVIGVVQAVNRIDGTFEETDKNNFEAFASQAAIAIENSRLFTSVREEKRKMEAVVKRIKEGAIVTDMAGEILLINSSAKCYLEHEKHKFTNICAAFPDFEVKPPLDNCLGSDEPVYKFELFRAKPKKFFLDCSSIRLFKEDKEGNQIPEGRLWILSDVTAQKLEEYMARNFLSLISHKFKTPLASINGFAQILHDETEKSQDLPDIIKKASATIQGQGKKLNKLVESLLNFVTVDSLDDTALEKIDFDAGEFLTEVAEAAKGWTQDTAGVSIKIAVPEPVPLRADRKLLASALKGMIDNAVKFNQGKDKLVILSAQARDGFSLISVGDNGPGIPGEELENIFQKFYQVEAAFTGQVEGWGLGLAMVKKVAEVHGGRVFAKSQLQKGSAITIALPG